MKATSVLFDLLVVGGGINGVGIAADAAGRGLSVALCEKGDLASATSSASTKLIHGGLRYLETYEFGLVRKALHESEILLGLAPHLIQPMTFYIPYMPHQRPWILIRLGLFLYNTLTYRPHYKKAGSVRFPEDSPLVTSLTHGFHYADGQVDDARLVILNAIQAANKGAVILPRHECLKLNPTATHWEATLENRLTGEQQQINARAVVNATGPWVSQWMQHATQHDASRQVRLVKGSHIVVPRMHKGDAAYLLQNEDGRVVFVIPWQQQFTLIGTTEEEFSGDPDQVRISSEETEYLLESVNRYFRTPLAATDIVYSYSGIRPLMDDPVKSATKASRDYLLEFEDSSLPILTVYGGKVTTYRLMAQQAVNKLGKVLGGVGRSHTRKAPLPGGDFRLREQLYQVMISSHRWLPAELIKRWIGAYGKLCFDILKNVQNVAELGQYFGHSLYQREVDYLVDREWAVTAEDILWRRTKLGLLFDEKQEAALREYLMNRVPGSASRRGR